MVMGQVQIRWSKNLIHGKIDFCEKSDPHPTPTSENSDMNLNPSGFGCPSGAHQIYKWAGPIYKMFLKSALQHPILQYKFIT
jgi:hypothetical protein